MQVTLLSVFQNRELRPVPSASTTLIRNLIDIASNGGNYLLNIGPKGDGSIPVESIKSFQAIGTWMKVNSEAIYGTTASPFKNLKWGRATRKGDTVYLHVFDWPKDGNLFVPLKNKVKEARLLAGKKVKTSVTKSGMTIRLPATAPDAIASVIKLTIVGEPEVITDSQIP